MASDGWLSESPNRGPPVLGRLQGPGALGATSPMSAASGAMPAHLRRVVTSAPAATVLGGFLLVRFRAAICAETYIRCTAGSSQELIVCRW